MSRKNKHKQGRRPLANFSIWRLQRKHEPRGKFWEELKFAMVFNCKFNLQIGNCSVTKGRNGNQMTSFHLHSKVFVTKAQLLLLTP